MKVEPNKLLEQAVSASKLSEDITENLKQEFKNSQPRPRNEVMGFKKERKKNVR